MLMTASLSCFRMMSGCLPMRQVRMSWMLWFSPNSAVDIEISSHCEVLLAMLDCFLLCPLFCRLVQMILLKIKWWSQNFNQFPRNKHMMAISRTSLHPLRTSWIISQILLDETRASNQNCQQSKFSGTNRNSLPTILAYMGSLCCRLAASVSCLKLSNPTPPTAWNWITTKKLVEQQMPEH